MNPMDQQNSGAASTLDTAASNAASTAQQISNQADQALKNVRESLDQAMAGAAEKARDAARYADRQVQNNPWTAVGIGFAAGVVFGALVALAAGANRRSPIARIF
jgi:ElaB/YqjD/DUF883 family membrane-anchored ribosome-binding protein